MMQNITKQAKDKLIRLSHALIDQKKAKVLIRPMKNLSGFWFGAGNMVEDNKGNFYLSGRYRNYGDSRTGLYAGERGVELAIFKSEDRGKSFKKIVFFSKEDLSYRDRRVLSIEGSFLHFTEEEVELYVSTEKTGIPYPEGLEEFKKPGTGVWSIDIIKAKSIEKLKSAKIKSLLEGEDPKYLHLKDPVVFKNTQGNTFLIFCTNPFTWASSNSGLAIRPKGSSDFKRFNYTFFSRGFTWDVAISRITGVLHVPKKGFFADMPSSYLFFYDGGESMRKYEEHPHAIKRPRGYSCEEIGGLAFSTEKGFPEIECLSDTLSFFTSPFGTGCSRYVKTLQTEEGIFATWQQSQKDLSQPLVVHFLDKDKVEEILA
jgi:hypothetical protein